MALPLPSSPHWAPIRTSAGIGGSRTEEEGRCDCRGPRCAGSLASARRPPPRYARYVRRSASPASARTPLRGRADGSAPGLVRSATSLVGEAREAVQAYHRLALRADALIADLEEPLRELVPGLRRLAAVLDDPVVDDLPDTVRQLRQDLLPVLRTLADTHERVAFVAGLPGAGRCSAAGAAARRRGRSRSSTPSRAPRCAHVRSHRRDADRRRGPVDRASRSTSCQRAGSAAQGRPTAARVAVGEEAVDPLGLVASRRSRPPRGRARAGRAGSPGWARATTGPARSPSSRPGAARRARGGSRSGRTRRTPRPRRAPSAASASAAQAALDVGCAAATSAGSSSRAARRPGRREQGRLGAAEQVLAGDAHADSARAASGPERADVRPGRAGGAQVLAGLRDPGGHAGLGRLAPGARVVELLGADLAVDLEHAVVVLEHVVDDRPGEGVLRVGVDVHLHDAVVERLADLLEREPLPPWKTRSNGLSTPVSLPTASWISLRIDGRSLTLPGL